MSDLNCFNALGLPANHRPINKVVQLVKHFDDVNKRANEGVYHKNVKFPMYAQVKKDGVFAMMIKTSFGTGIFNRTGKLMKNVTHLAVEFDKLVPTCGVYIGELVSDDCSLEVLSGIVNPNRVNTIDHAQYLISKGMKIMYHDYIRLNEFIAGYSPITYAARYWNLTRALFDSKIDVLPLELVSDETELRRFSDKMIANGQEGGVFKQDVEWLAGAKDWHSMKIVRGIHVDLECIGWEEGNGKYRGLVANLLFRYKNGLVVKAMLGKGWTHQDAQGMFNCIKRGHTGNEDGYLPWSYPIGKIFHVYGLQESSKGIIRLPKVSELRHDKCKADY